MDIADVLYATAGAGALVRGSRVTPTEDRIADIRRTVERFLQNCPDDYSVMELRRAIEDLD